MTYGIFILLSCINFIHLFHNIMWDESQQLVFFLITKYSKSLTTFMFTETILFTILFWLPFQCCVSTGSNKKGAKGIVLLLVHSEHLLVGNIWCHIHQISLYLQLANGPNKLECYITQGWKDLPVTHILSY